MELDCSRWTRVKTALLFVLLVADKSSADGFNQETQWGRGMCEDGDLCAVGDFDGSGGDDIIRFAANGDVYVALSTGTAFSTPQLWRSGFASPSSFPRVGDFNGDGKDDIVEFDGDIEVALSLGDEFDAPDEWLSSLGTFYSDNPILVGDVDGDGDDEITFLWDDGSVDVYMTDYTPSLHFEYVSGAYGNWAYDQVFEWDAVFRMADVDGDGDADIVRFWNDSSGDVVVALSNGVDEFVIDINRWHVNLALADEVPEMGDFDGDGSADVASFKKQGTRDVLTALAVSGAFGTESQEHSDFCSDSDQCFTGDFDGDGKADLVAFVTEDGTYREGDVLVSRWQTCSVMDTPGASCTDGLWCNGSETCQANTTCAATTLPCDDENACTLDACDETSHCTGHPLVDPDDSNACTVDWCDPATGVGHAYAGEGTPCGNGDVCDGLELCGAGHDGCQSITGPDPDDGNACTTDTCGANGISHVYLSDGTGCSDGLACNGTELCGAGACLPGTAPTGPACYTCTEGSGGAEWTTPSADSTPCDDGNACTIGDECDGSGSCEGTPVTTGTSCSDGNICNGAELCNGSGVCQSGTAPDLDDDNPCTDDVCTGGDGIQHNALTRGTECTIDSIVKACDGAGRCILETSETAAPAPEPSDLEPDISMNFEEGTAFLYEGEDAIQKQENDDPAELTTGQTGVLRGRVLGRDQFGGPGEELPLPNVVVRVAGYPEQGATLTRDDGHFDIAVDAGKVVTLEFEHDGYLTAQRTQHVPQNDYFIAEDVILAKPSATETAVTLCASCSSPDTVAVGDQVEDDSGARQGRVFIPGDTSASIVWSDGTTSGSGSTHDLLISVTEYTVGPNGTRAMPGDLPATSGYTYAVELGAKRASDGKLARTVTFSQEVPYYVDNFLNFDVGSDVPAGYYDRAAHAWKKGTTGRVIKLVGITSNAVDIDIDSDQSGGDAGAEDPSVLLSTLGITLAEREALADEYPQADTEDVELWRTPMTHFTPWDCNWPYGPKPCSQGGPCTNDDDGSGGGPGPGPGPKPCKKDGSIIECENQVLGESLPIAGTDVTLNYRSRDAAGFADARTVTFRLPGTDKSERKRFEARLVVAGQVVASETYPATAYGQEIALIWDGNDGYGRRVVGQVKAKLDVDEFYAPVYYAATEFAGMPPSLTAIATGSSANNRTEVRVRRSWMADVGGFDAGQIGGWTLSQVHRYDVNARVLYTGDGERRAADAEQAVIETVAQVVGSRRVVAAPDGSLYVAAGPIIRKVSPGGSVSLFAGTVGQSGFIDNVAATSAKLSGVNGMALATDGTVYIADAGNNRVRYVGPDGNIHTLAGSTSGFQDGAIASAQFNTPVGLALAPDGALYVADRDNHRVRVINPERTSVRTIAGTGSASSICTVISTLDGSLATGVALNPWDVAVGPTGSIFLTDPGNSDKGFVLEIKPNGTVGRVAGACSGTPGDGGAARSAVVAYPEGLSIAPDGSIYVAEEKRVRKIDVARKIRTVAGDGTNFAAPESGVVATATHTLPNGVALGPDGTLFLVEASTTNGRVRRVAPVLPGRPSSGEIVIASGDGSERYVFDADGRHTETINTLTGTTLRTVERDSENRVVAIATLDNGAVPSPTNEVTIQYDGNGDPELIVGPFGHETAVTLDSNKHLASVQYPLDSEAPTGNDTIEFVQGADGLLTQMVDARGYSHLFKYSSTGRLIEDRDPAGGAQVMAREPLALPALGYAVEHTDADGYETTYTVETPASGSMIRSVAHPDGTTTTFNVGVDGSTTLTMPDGTVTVSTTKPDPLVGMLAPYAATETTTTGGKTRTVVRTRTLTGTVLSPDVLTETSTIDFPSNDPTTIVAYDFDTRTRTTTSPAGRTVTETLDLAGRVASISRPGILDIEFERDSYGRIVSKTQGTRVKSTTYYPLVAEDLRSGYTSSVTDEESNITSLLPDALGRAVEQTTAGMTTLMTWDPQGNLVDVQPDSKPHHAMTYTPNNLISAYLPPSVGSSSEATSYAYTPARRQTLELRPDGLFLQRDYDSAGRLDSITTPLGNLEYAYFGTSPPSGGAPGRLSQIVGPGTGDFEVTLDFEYFGQLAKKVTWSGGVDGSVAWDYDQALRVATQSISPGGPASTITFQRDLDGLVTCASPTTCPSGAKALRVSYDTPAETANGLPREVLLDGGDYDLTEAFTYNSYGELASQEVAYDSASIFSIVYDTVADPRDQLGRIVKKTEVVASQTTTWEYSYDDAGRLSQVWKDSVSQAEYDYDGNGNRLSVDGGANSIATYDDQDRLLTYGNAAYSYGPNGELQAKTVGSNITSYAYDAYGNLRSVILPDGKHVEYLVDGLGRRVGRRVDGVVHRMWLYESRLEPVAELDGTGAFLARFVYGAHQSVPEMMIRSDGVYRIVSDQVGSVRLVIKVSDGTNLLCDQSGGCPISQMIEYDTWGNATLLAGTWDFQPFGFAGGIFDEYTNFVRFGARDYDPGVGRWTRKDPIRFDATGTNLYLYAMGDPINFVDTNGLQPVPGGHGGPGFDPGSGGAGGGGGPPGAPPGMPCGKGLPDPHDPDEGRCYRQAANFFSVCIESKPFKQCFAVAVTIYLYCEFSTGPN